MLYKSLEHMHTLKSNYKQRAVLILALMRKDESTDLLDVWSNYSL